MKKMAFVILVSLLLSFPVLAAESSPEVPITRVVRECAGSLQETHVAALRESAKLLGETRPDLSRELTLMAEAALS